MHKQSASPRAGPGYLKTILAEGGMPGFGTTTPAIIPAGQKVRVEQLTLRLGGKVLTPVSSGLINNVFINDADVYLLANQLRDGKTPTAVRLRFDLALGTAITGQPGTPKNITQSLANGVFNQTVMNIQAAGTVKVRDNGDLVINAVGSFPIKVNRTGSATVDLELQLVLRAQGRPQGKRDQSHPYVTAQLPSACLYVFGTPGFESAYEHGVSPTVLPEQLCRKILAGNGQPPFATPPFVNSFPIGRIRRSCSRKHWIPRRLVAKVSR